VTVAAALAAAAIEAALTVAARAAAGGDQMKWDGKCVGGGLLLSLSSTARFGTATRHGHQ